MHELQEHTEQRNCRDHTNGKTHKLPRSGLVQQTAITTPESSPPHTTQRSFGKQTLDIEQLKTEFYYHKEWFWATIWKLAVFGQRTLEWEGQTST